MRLEYGCRSSFRLELMNSYIDIVSSVFVVTHVTLQLGDLLKAVETGGHQRSFGHLKYRTGRDRSGLVSLKQLDVW